MDENFKENLKFTPNQQEDMEMMKIEAYKEFVYEAMPGYIAFLEAINHTITELELEGIIGKAKLKSRVKAINSALQNTEEKTLDDIFGFEIVLENERDKEVLMLIMHNLFVEKYVRQKNHNKSNGYFAHHCTGAVKNELNGNETERLEQHILESETYELKPEYRDMPKKEQKKFKKDEIYCEKPRYPILRNEILEQGMINYKLQENFDWALGFIDQYLSEMSTLRKNMPVMEMQFKTIDVEREAKCGRAQHVKYKKVNEEQITQLYLDRKLVRGVDFPFTFVRNDNGDLEIEHSNKTLVSMWPFLHDTIEQYNKANNSKMATYDMYFAKVFPDLEPYVKRNSLKEPYIPVEQFSAEMAWNGLKNRIINNSFYLPDAKNIVKKNENENEM